MENIEMISLWKAYDKRLEESLVLNRNLTLDVTRLKTNSLLQSMRPIKVFTLLAGIIWVGIGVTIVGKLFVHAYSKVSPFFLYSAAFQLLLTAVAIFIYIYQLIVIQQVDISEPIVATQRKLASLKTSTIWVTRILLLQLPAWAVFYWPSNLFMTGNVRYIAVNVSIALLFAFCAAWFFINIDYRNKEKKWFKMIFQGKEWTPILQSIELYDELKSFEKEK